MSRAAWLPNERVLPEGPFQRAFTQDGFEVVDYFDHLRTFVVRGRPSEVARLLAHDFVHFVDLDRRIGPHHDRSMRQIHIDSVRVVPPYDGRDSVVGAMDSGFDVNHADLSGAWYAGWTWNSNNPFTDANGHGSHVLGTILARGAGLDPRVLGCAPGTGLTTNRRVYLATAWGGTNRTAVNTVAALTRCGTPITINNVLTPSPSVVNHSWGVTRKVTPAPKSLQLVLKAAEWTGTTVPRPAPPPDPEPPTPSPVPKACPPALNPAHTPATLSLAADLAPKKELLSPAEPRQERVGEYHLLRLGQREYRVGGLEKNNSLEVLKVAVRLRHGEDFHLDSFEMARDGDRRRFIDYGRRKKRGWRKI